MKNRLIHASRWVRQHLRPVTGPKAVKVPRTITVPAPLAVTHPVTGPAPASGGPATVA